MAIVYKTTLKPSKMELLSAWLPSRPWYQGTDSAPELVKAGGFRLDDPAGEVGLEFYVARHGAGERATAYHAPMTYQGAPLDGAGDALIGTTEHGVLGHRWVYDATRDPLFAVLVAALLRGEAEPMAASVNDTPDPTVRVGPYGGAGEADGFTASDDVDGTVVRIGAGERAIAVRVHRVLVPVTDPAPGPGQVSAPWRLDDDAQVRGVFLSAGPGE